MCIRDRILSIGYWIAGIFLFCGLKVLKPQEALVLTLFGDYIGTCLLYTS